MKDILSLIQNDTCSFGLQLEEVLNRTSPFSIWINGEKIDILEQEGQRQNREFKNLEEKYTEMADGVDNIFTDSMKVQFTFACLCAE